MQTLTHAEVESLLASAVGNVSYQSQYARTTALVIGGRVRCWLYASEYMRELKYAEYKASYIPPMPPTVSGARTQPYAGPFPRGRHSHKCKGCEARGQYNAVACYKKQCKRPQLTATCEWCASYYTGK